MKIVQDNFKRHIIWYSKYHYKSNREDYRMDALKDLGKILCKHADFSSADSANNKYILESCIEILIQCESDRPYKVSEAISGVMWSWFVDEPKTIEETRAELVDSLVGFIGCIGVFDDVGNKLVNFGEKTDESFIEMQKWCAENL